MPCQKTTLFILVCVSFSLFFSCREKVEIIEGRRYFAERGTPSGREYLAAPEKNESVTILRGTLGYKEIAGKKYPALFSLTDSGIACTLLDSIPDNGLFSLVEINAAPAQGRRAKWLSQPPVRVVSWKRINSLKWFLDGTRSYWQANRLKLEAKSNPDSRFKLPPEPQWRVVADEKNGVIIVSCMISNSMWEWDFDFVWSIKGSSLERAYSHQWFKGE